MAARLADDTPQHIEQRQIEGWRRMTTIQKAELITLMSRSAFDVALAGVRHRYPDASPRERCLRLAILTLGPELAAKAYPEITQLTP